MRSIFTQPNIYTLFWLVYYMQNILYAGSSTFSKLLALVFLILSIYYFFKVHSEYKVSGWLKSLDVLVILFSLYGAILLLLGTDSTWMRTNFLATDFLKGSLLSFLPIYSFYYFTRKNMISEKWLKIFLFVLLWFCMVRYYYEQEIALLESYNSDGVTNNAGYIWLAILPFIVLFEKRPVIQVTLYLLIAFFIISGMKRGAILIFVLASAFFFWYRLKNAKQSQKLGFTLLIALALFFIADYVRDLISSSSFFNARLQATLEGDTSQRDVIYMECWNAFKNSSPLNMIFGNGALGTMKVAGEYAHQDWLQTLVDFGILGIICVFSYFVSLFKALRDSKKYCTSQLYILYGVLFITYFVKTLFSMSLTSAELMTTSLLGYCYGVYTIAKESPEPNIMENE